MFPHIPQGQPYFVDKTAGCPSVFGREVCFGLGKKSILVERPLSNKSVVQAENYPLLLSEYLFRLNVQPYLSSK
jgi:hypothetical protein